MSLRLARAALGLLLAGGAPQAVHAGNPPGSTFTATLLAGDTSGSLGKYPLVNPASIHVDLIPSPARTAFGSGTGSGAPGQSRAIVMADSSNSQGLDTFLSTSLGNSLWLEITITNANGKAQPHFFYPVAAPGYPSSGQGGPNAQLQRNPSGPSHDELYNFPITGAPSSGD